MVELILWLHLHLNESLIKQLGSTDFYVRQKASKCLLVVGKEKVLEKALDSPDLEVAYRAKRILYRKEEWRKQYRYAIEQGNNWCFYYRNAFIDLKDDEWIVLIGNEYAYPVKMDSNWKTFAVATLYAFVSRVFIYKVEPGGHVYLRYPSPLRVNYAH